MAEFEEIAEIIEEAGEGIEDEAADAEGIEGDDLVELEVEAAEAAEASATLGRVVEGLKALGDLTLSLVKFVGKTAAVGAIFYGVTVALKKLTARAPTDQGAKQKYAKIKKVSQFITSASDLTKKVSDWLKDDKITLDGIEVPLIAIFVKYTTPLADVSRARAPAHV